MSDGVKKMSVYAEIANIYNHDVLPHFFDGQYKLAVIHGSVLVQKNVQIEHCLYYQELPSKSSCAVCLIDKRAGKCASSITMESRPDEPALIDIASKTVPAYRRKGLNIFLRMLVILLVPCFFPRAQYIISDGESEISRNLNKRLGFVHRPSLGPLVYSIRLETAVIDRVINALIQRFTRYVPNSNTKTH